MYIPSGASSSLVQRSGIPTFDDGLPRSLRDAPDEQHKEIRRRQNLESARRCRRRDRAQMEFMEQKYEENQARLSFLENTVDMLKAELSRK